MQSSKEFWQSQLNYLQNLLATEEGASDHGRQVVQEEIAHAQRQLQAIADGTYKKPEVVHEVWTGVRDPRMNQAKPMPKTVWKDGFGFRRF